MKIVLSSLNMNKYASHLPILSKIFQAIPIHNVFEFGCGFFSTSFFVKNCSKVTSVEMQSNEWYSKIKEQFKSKNLNLIYSPENAIAMLNLCEKFDLIFVDGIDRPNCTNHSFSKTNIIVIHDLSEWGWTNKKSSWKALKIPQDFKSFLIRMNKPRTSILTSDDKLIRYIKATKEFKALEMFV